MQTLTNAAARNYWERVCLSVVGSNALVAAHRGLDYVDDWPSPCEMANLALDDWMKLWGSIADREQWDKWKGERDAAG